MQTTTVLGRHRYHDAVVRFVIQTGTRLQLQAVAHDLETAIINRQRMTIADVRIRNCQRTNDRAGGILVNTVIAKCYPRRCPVAAICNDDVERLPIAYGEIEGLETICRAVVRRRVRG